MRTVRISLAAVLLFTATMVTFSQNPYPKNYFRSPVGYPITLAGSFGEIRKNHFHSGIDIRTGGVEGKPVYAIADGYVARVNVSPGGFGKALYLAHPNGYTSLYGHLRNYADPIAAWVKNQQYKKESFAIDIEVPEGTLKVKKGDLIAYTGNSGASGGPHLHFEIRDTKTQEIIDPLDFGLMKTDNIPPKISWIKIYPMGPGSTVNGGDKAVLLPVTGAGSNYRLKMEDTVRVSGGIIFGIETADNSEGGLKTGLHVIRLEVDGEMVFTQDIERFAFTETRYVNSVIDYPAYVLNKRKIQRSYLAPNNRMDIYTGVTNRGVVTFADTKTHMIRYTVKDAFGNPAVLSFPVKSHVPVSREASPPARGDQLMSYTTDNRFERGNIRFEVPADALYDDLPFRYSGSAPVPGSFSTVHRLHDKYTPLHTWCTLSLKAEKLPARLASRAVIVSVEPGNKFISRGGTYENGWITTRIRDFGNYTVAVDTVPPVIRAVNIFPNKNIKKQSTIMVKVSDNLSGIKAYRGTLNGKWILMDYDEKNRLLTYRFDERMKPGKNMFHLTVTDAAGNSSQYQAALAR
jgi:hypothetical protein